MTGSVLVVTSDPGGPVLRHRFGLYRSALRAAGIEVEVGPWPKDGALRRRTLVRAAAADAVMVSSRLLARRDVERFRQATARLGFDFDDALPYRDSRRAATASRTRMRRFEAIVATADRVTAGNAYLAGLAREAGAVPVTIPTVVPVPHAFPPEPDEGTLRLGWIGSRATLSYLEGAGPALASVQGECLVRVIADAAPRFPKGVRSEFVRWTPDGAEAALAGTHAGLAPLPDDRWTRGKCGLKLLQSLALGRPVVASAVGVQREQVVDGETGFLCDDDEAFAAGVDALLEDGERRRRMGRAAFDDVRARWSVEAWAPAVVGELRALLDGAPRAVAG